MKHPKCFKKITYSAVAVLLTLSFGASIATPVYANLPVVDITAQTDRVATEVIDKVKEVAKKSLVSALSAEMVNLLSMMAGQLASNTAIWVASGGNAESPLFNSLPPADYFKYAGAAVLSDIYNEVVIENFEDGLFPSLNIYLPTDPDVLQAVRLGIKSITIAPEISFEYPSIKNNWSSYLASVSSTNLEPEEKTAQILSIMAESFDPDVNELSAITQLQLHTVTTVYSEAQKEDEQLTANNGFMAIEHYITGQIETGASMVEAELTKALEIQKDLPFNLSTSLMANSDTLISIGINAGTIFTNTIFSELMNKLQGGLFEDIVFDDSNPFDPDSAIEYSRDRIVDVFKSLTSFKPLEITDYSLLSELATCPSLFRGSSVGLYNCALDSSFVSAIALSRTGATVTLQDAIDEGYVDGGWPLIPSSDSARNQDPKCYTYGFCHSNLVKLRKARIIPIGWELAAESDFNSDTDPVTLQEAIDGFYTCNGDGEIDDANPWCHLVDPNWVLKFPETQCRTLAYGQILSAFGTDQRAEECVDIQSCISEDANGNCDGGYGYCVREENTWKFRGQECPEHYASCMTFDIEEGGAVDFLTNTIDYGDCSASNMGCLWNSTQKEVDSEGVYDWPVIEDVEANDLEVDAYQNRLYFNSEVTVCESEDTGCEQLYERGSDTSLNIISNSSFETDADEDGIPDGWLIDGSVYSTDDTQSRSGSDAIDLESAAGSATRMGIVLNQTRYYALSVYAMTKNTGSDIGTLSLTVSDSNGVPADMSYQSLSEDCSEDCDVVCYVPSTSTSTVALEAEVRDDGYKRFECIFSTPTLTDRSLDLYAELTLTGDLTFDDIMLEQDSDTTIYSSGYSDDELTSVYMKVAPDYLGCTGGDDDADDCANYAQMCSEQDAGCGEYTPANGDPSVTAVISILDQCPSTCDGYDTYRQEASTYEPYGDFPLYFIPSSADTCNQSAVGCTEFTNIDTEALEYYTYLRSCVTEYQARANVSGDNAAIFYTWEGSDEEGYQLRTWNLIESDLDDAAYHDYIYADSGEVDVRPGLAPCTTWTTEEDGIYCADDDGAYGDLIINSESSSCDEHSDIISNPECREFYDTQGGIHYRVWDDTVTVNDSCVSYRLTDLAGEDATDWQDTCETAQGYYDSSSAVCRFYGYSTESASCAESNNGCREFTGGRSANSRSVLQDVFESGSIVNWDANSASTVTLSNESVAVDGHSLKSQGQDVWSYLYDNGSVCATEDGCASSAGTLGGSCVATYGDQLCGTLENNLYTNKTYTLTFWAKGDTDLQVGFDVSADTSVLSIDSLVSGVVPSVELTSVWTYYSVGPFDMNENDYSAFGAGSVLAFVPNSTGDFYIDNIALREGEDELTLIKDSWTTPASCDQTWEGTTSPQEQLGCQQYLDQDSETVYLKSFRDLCDSDAVGCKAYYTTEQSDSEYVSVYNATCYNVLDSDGNVDQATERTGCYVYTNTARTEFDTTSPLLCTIIAGEDHCKFDFEDWFIPQADISDLSAQPELYHLNYGPDATFAKADTDAYLIYDEELECSSSSVAGCTELGAPTFSRDLSTVDEWTSVFYINDPDQYDDVLCDHDELFCKAFETDSEGTWYFKDPIGHECEYKSDVTIDGTGYSGWFRRGTTEFCYGSGTCTELLAGVEVSCEKDSECAVRDLGECNITDGEYLIGGSESGIWRNGDTDYAGWVGHCSAEYDGCSAFEDPLDIDDDEFYGEADGTFYYYIDDDQLNDSSLFSSQKCNGQVSQKEGCTLFYDNGDAGLDYNASATYVVSAHADEILGESPFSLVDPIDCSTSEDSTITLPDGVTTYDPCANRCVYFNADLHESSFDIDTISPIVIESLATFGNSCFTDSDCPDHESDLGDFVSGDCLSEVQWIHEGVGAGITSGLATRLENDTNRVISVNQDRVCSEWLSCSSSYSIWDQDTGRYRTICDGIDLCTEYSAEGHPSFCSAWDPSTTAVVLDEGRYVSRDVTWYGDEYSGYSVPNLLSLEHLSQINIAPPTGQCDMSSDYNKDDTEWQEYHGESCSFDDECGAGSASAYIDNYFCIAEQEEDFRLGYIAGSCTENYSEDCAVGYCTDNNAACTSIADCESTDAFCVPGVCYEVTTTVCTEDSECDTDNNEECLSGTCVIQGGYCDLENLACGTDETCFTSVAYKQGSCYGESCFLAMDGEPFEEAMYEGQVCRAYPEINSPFGNTVVSEWNVMNSGELSKTSDITLSLSSSSVGAISPRTLRSGFEQVETCSPGEDCVCSYAKISTSNGSSAYLDIASPYLDGPFVGICSSTSPVAGSVCTNDGNCAIAVDDGGSVTESEATCERVTDEDILYGLDGYCLERDTGLNIEGDQYTGACLTWLPIDQLSGGTDLYAKYKTAGFYDDVYMCSYLEPSVSVGTSITDLGEGYVACAEVDDGGISSCSGTDDLIDCAYNAECPEDFFAVIGECAPSSSDASGAYADLCTESPGDNDCPYICVPKNSYDTEGTFCEDLLDEDLFYSNGHNYNETDYWTYANPSPGDYTSFNGVVDQFIDCRVHGVDMDSDWYSQIVSYDPASDTSSTSGCTHSSSETSGYRCMYTDIIPYPACEELLEVSSYNESYAWTDKIYFGGAIVDSDDRFEYEDDTTPNVFGASQYAPGDLEIWDPPVMVGACEEGAVITMPGPTDGFSECDDSFYDIEFNQGTNPENPSARSFISFSYTYNAAIGYYPSVGNWIVSGSQEDILGRITQAFAKVDFGSLFTWGNSEAVTTSPTTSVTNSYEEDTGGASAFSSMDEADVRSSGNPPTVWAIDDEDCGTRYCSEGPDDSLTLNGQNLGDFAGDEGFFRATLKFFAAADKNQLPIRRVIVDWGDNDQTGSTGDDNYYKNHRGLQDGSDDGGDDSLVLSKCDLGTEWGLTGDSCDPNYFVYQHSYRCNNPIDLPTCIPDDEGNLTNSPCSDDDVSCSYQPRVHVRDNWGWCTGSCEDYEKEGCFDGEGTIEGTGIQDFCDYDYHDAWIYYDGIIYVEE